jgi:integrase
MGQKNPWQTSLLWAVVRSRCALSKYLEQKDDLHAGRKPRQVSETGVTVKDLANAFLNHKQALVDSGELTPRTFEDYTEVATLVVNHFGKSRSVIDLGPDDFAELRNKLAKRWGLHRLARTIQHIRSMFLFAFDQELIEKPVRHGKVFKGPNRKAMRLHKARQGKKLFSREEIHKLLGATGPQLKAMILLGINCGYGNADCGTLPQSALDLDVAHNLWWGLARTRWGRVYSDNYFSPATTLTTITNPPL